MAELSIDEKSKLAAALIEQSPPGEVNDVINDIRAIIGDDTALMVHAQPALRSHNVTQLHVVEHPAADGIPAHSSLLSETAILPGSAETERYVDAEGKKSYAFDHVQLVASDYQPYELPEEEEKFRSELAKSLKAYCKNHFSSGVSSVNCSQYPLLPPEPEKPVEEKSEEVPAVAAEEPVKEATEQPVTDVVPEQVGSGEEGPAPTPAVGDEEKKEEVTEEGGLEQVDEDLEELKVEDKEADQKEVSEEVGTKAESQSHTPQVTEEETEVDPAPQSEVEEPATAAAAPAEPMKQEKLDNPTYTLEITGTKYNPSNFWTGRWRTKWVVDQAAGQVTGAINVDVHYYEQGNVQLATSHTASFPCPAESIGSQSIASQIVTTLAKIETNYQLELNDVYGDLGDKAFRSLRRALPVTRQKMDWEKVGGYSLGSDLTKARG